MYVIFSYIYIAIIFFHIICVSFNTLSVIALLQNFLHTYTHIYIYKEYIYMYKVTYTYMVYIFNLAYPTWYDYELSPTWSLRRIVFMPAITFLFPLQKLRIHFQECVIPLQVKGLFIHLYFEINDRYKLKDLHCHGLLFQCNL